MTDRLSHFSNSYFAYLNYWRPSASMGTNTFHSRSSRITDKFDMRHKWQILAIASCVVIAVTLGIGIYSATLYQNSSRATTAASSTATTDTTTTAVTTSRDTTAASTADSGNTLSSITTTAIPTVAGDTTSAAVSTEVVTTKTPPICPSMLPFGDDAGDVNANKTFKTPFSYTLWGIKVPGGYIKVDLSNGYFWLKSNNTQVLEVKAIADPYPTTDWPKYYRNVSSKADKDAIACLVHNSQPVQAIVATLTNNNMTELQAIQLIVASFGPSGTYIIRIYSKTLPETGDTHPVQIHFTSKDGTFKYFADDKVQDVAGRRQIFDVSKALDDGQNLIVIEEGQNCDVFIC